MNSLPKDPWGFTPRQRVIVAMLASTGSQKVTAHRAGVTINTVNTIVQRAKAAMGVHTPMQVAIAWARWEENVKEPA